jgi:hypothetical protein
MRRSYAGSTAGSPGLKVLFGLTVAWISLLFLGCDVPHPVGPIVIPPTAEIESVTVFPSLDKGSAPGFHIDDRPAIEAIVALLRVDNTGYSSSVGKLPPEEYSVALDGGGKMRTMVWVYPGWLGGVDSEHSDKQGLISRFRKLDPAQHAQLVALLSKYKSPIG